MHKRITVTVILMLGIASCARRPDDLPQLDAKAYSDSIDAFHARRRDAIAGPDGWATLVGLWWLEPGVNRIGSDTTFEISVPANRSPRQVGTVEVAGDSAIFRVASGVHVTLDSQPVTSPVRLRSDVEGKQTIIHVGSLHIGYITRSGRKAIRIKDTLAVARMSFAGHQYFPADTAWRLTARFVPREKPDSMDIIDVLGIQTRMSWPGELRFHVGGKQYALQVIREPEDHGKRLFVMFRDSTNGHETYPAMRYTYVDPPDSLGRTILDFNEAYSPPCAFTSFATCPLPPRGNTLPLRITAGELKPAGH